jgi:hypothetical protein
VRRLLAVPLVAAATALAPAAAHGAAVQTTRSCYLQTQNTTVQLSGNGFTVGSPYTVSLDGQPLVGGTASIATDGTMSGSFAPPALTTRQNVRTFLLRLDSGGLAAETSFSLTRFSADYRVIAKPKVADPYRTRVQFFAYGFGLAVPTPTIYAHYLSPTAKASEPGRLRKTIRLGASTGPCGTLNRAPVRRLFPFPNPKFGLWQLQFDTQHRYELGTNQSVFPWIRRGICIQPAGAAAPSAGHPCPTRVRGR